MNHKDRLRYIVATMALVVSVVAPASLEGQVNVCLGQLTNYTLPTIDGALAGDSGWFSAIRLNMNDNLGVQRTAFADLVVKSGYLFLGIEVDDPDSTYVDDTVVIAFSVPGSEQWDWRVHIKPWDANGQPVCPGAPQPCTPKLFTYWRNSGGWDLAGAPALSPGPNTWVGAAGNAAVVKNGTSWTMELRIPLESSVNNVASDAKVYLPSLSPGTFQMYVNVLSTSSFLGENSVVQAAWPPAAKITPPAGISYLTRLTPVPGDWGTVSLYTRPACTGVSIVYSDVGVRYTNNQSDPLVSTVKYYNPPQPFPADCTTLQENGQRMGPSNYLIARPQNTAADPANVSVAYAIKNYGIPGATHWDTVNVGLAAGQTNPTAERSIPAGQKLEYSIDWALTYKQSCQYAQLAPPRNQCSRVLLDSTDKSVRFLSKDAMMNLYFAPASQLDVPAEISAQGYGPPPAGRTTQRFLLTVRNDVQKYQQRDNAYRTVASRKDQSVPPLFAEIASALFPRGLDEALTQTVRGYRLTGHYVIMDAANQNKYEMGDYVGGYAIVAGHKGAVAAWTHELAGPGVKRVSDTRFLLDIKPETAQKITSRLEARERGCFAGAPQGLMLLALGLVAVGLAVHLPRRRRSR